MQSYVSRFTKKRRGFTAKCHWLGLLLIFIAGAAAHSAGDRPRFQAPFPCFQQWDASTYWSLDPDKNHWPDADSIDLTLWRDSDDKANEEGQVIKRVENRSDGQPVLASASGRVFQDFLRNNGERRVILDHGGNWFTHYIHLQLEDQVLETGRRFSIGETIGWTGRTGTDPYDQHIHYTQLRDGALPPNGEAVRVRFNGMPLDTHANNSASYDTHATSDAERIYGRNCAGISFAQWSDSGREYIFRYKPSQRKARVMRLDVNGQGATTTWSNESWDKTWTHFATYRSGGSPYLIRYKASNGQASFLRIHAGGSGATILPKTKWAPGWTHLETFIHHNTNILIAYNSVLGYFNMDRILSDNTSLLSIQKTSIETGWTIIEPFDLEGSQYVLFYAGGSGDIKISRVTGDGNNLGLQEHWSANRQAGWTTLSVVRDKNNTFLYGYNTYIGNAKIWRIKSGGDGIEPLSDLPISSGWTALTTYTEGNNGRLLLYNGVHLGVTEVFAFNNDGSGLTSKWTGTWDTGWR